VVISFTGGENRRNPPVYYIKLIGRTSIPRSKNLMGEGGGRRGSDRMEVGFTITYVIIAYFITTLVGFNPVHGV
jgi:hypothetical protein